MKRTTAKTPNRAKRRKSSRQPTRNRPAHNEHYVQELEKDYAELKLENQLLLASQADLEASRDRYLELYDTAPVCFISLTATAIIKEANQPARQLLKYDRSRLIGWPFNQLI